MFFEGTEVEIIDTTGSRGQGSREVEVMAIWRLLEVQDKVNWIPGSGGRGLCR